MDAHRLASVTSATFCRAVNQVAPLEHAVPLHAKPRSDRQRLVGTGQRPAFRRVPIPEDRREPLLRLRTAS
jgi:hypothetical protein